MFANNEGEIIEKYRERQHVRDLKQATSLQLIGDSKSRPPFNPKFHKYILVHLIANQVSIPSWCSNPSQMIHHFLSCILRALRMFVEIRFVGPQFLILSLATLRWAKYTYQPLLTYYSSPIFSPIMGAIYNMNHFTFKASKSIITVYYK